jgi:hypothetical protein
MATRAPQVLLDHLARMEGLRDPTRAQAKRQFHRYVVRGDAELLEQEGSQLERTVLPILLRDIGRGGIGFVCGQDLLTNSTWRVSFVDHGYVMGEQTLLIRHCQRVADNVYLIGGQFCAPGGLLCQAGVDPAILRQEDANADGVTKGVFVDPQQV